jgi:DNA ligase-1
MTLLAELAEVSRRVGGTSSRTAKIGELAAALRALDPSEIEIAVLYLSGELPQGKIGIQYSTLQTAAHVETADRATLSITDLDRRLTELAALRGVGSARKRTQELGELIALSTASERDFIFRLLTGELRQGALAGVMLEAIAAAANLAPQRVRRAAMYADSLGALARVAILEGTEGLARFQLQLLFPIAPMLAQTATNVADAMEQLGGEVELEWKMDGARIQVHKAEDIVHIYTRSANDVTVAVPEIVEAVREFSARSLILDGEAIAIDPAGRPHTFQTTMRRFGRRLDVAAMRNALPIQAYFFDCLLIDDESIADRPTRERIDALARAVPPTMQMSRLVTRSLEEAQAFYEASLAAGHEGLMAKSLDAPYEAGNRGASWLKIKRAHTLDLVVLAAEWGHGRRTGKLSNLHLGALDPAAGEYVMLGKTFKGLTDAMLEWQTQEFLAREVHRDGFTVYVRPELVVEIAFSDLQVSPRYPGGLALRLARVKRYRPDKRAEEADTMETVRKIAGAARV